MELHAHQIALFETSPPFNRRMRPLVAVKNLGTTIGARGWFAILLWPLLAALIAAVGWLATLRQIEAIEGEGRQAIEARARADADSYAMQLKHTVEQIDQVILRLKYEREVPHVPVDLKREREYGIFPENQHVYANIYDAGGTLVTSSTQRSAFDVSRLPYFVLH
ncbi:MAG TPA: hypothetical protein VM406_15850, partial [Noviherbaspirillum sp.]|nr:hypothetical protein [Noviherbaspirillum sp.]